jgi:toluene monooxygenase electron transfer component
VTRVAIVGSDLAFDCEPGDTVMRAALRAGVPFPYECNVGKCGSCRFELVDGRMQTLWEDAPALTERDRNLRRRLGCQSAPTADCTVKVRLDRNCLPATRPAIRSARLVEARNVTHDIREFTFRCDGPVQFRAGQYSLFHLPGVDGPRAYSMSNTANDAGILTFLIKYVRGGKGTQYLFEALPVGGSIRIDMPYGLAYFREEFDRDIVCIAGGSGISPILSIARQASEHRDFASRCVHVFYGGRGPSDICGHEFLRLLPRFGENITFSASISVPELDSKGMWIGPVGFVHEMVERAMNGRLGDCEYYLAGPPPMLQAAVQMLVLRHKVSLNRVHFDRFF